MMEMTLHAASTAEEDQKNGWLWRVAAAEEARLDSALSAGLSSHVKGIIK